MGFNGTAHTQAVPLTEDKAVGQLSVIRRYSLKLVVETTALNKCHQVGNTDSTAFNELHDLYIIQCNFFLPPETCISCSHHPEHLELARVRKTFYTNNSLP